MKLDGFYGQCPGSAGRDERDQVAATPVGRNAADHARVIVPERDGRTGDRAAVDAGGHGASRECIVSPASAAVQRRRGIQREARR